MSKQGWYYAIIFILSSCTVENREVKSSPTPEEVEKVKLYEAALEIHNEVMPYIDSLYSARGVIKKELERASEGLLELNDQRRKALEEIVWELEKADESMFDWMKEYGAMPGDTLSYDQIINKLERSLQEIRNTKNLMLESFEKAGKLIAQDSLGNQ